MPGEKESGDEPQYGHHHAGDENIIMLVSVTDWSATADRTFKLGRYPNRNFEASLRVRWISVLLRDQIR